MFKKFCLMGVSFLLCGAAVFAQSVTPPIGGSVPAPPVTPPFAGGSVPGPSAGVPAPTTGVPTVKVKESDAQQMKIDESCVEGYDADRHMVFLKKECAAQLGVKLKLGVNDPK